MTVATGVTIALVRSLVIAAIAVFAGERLAAGFRHLLPGRRRLAMVLCALPFAVPALVQGYAYSQLSLVRWPLALEAWYTALLTVRLIPVAVLVLYLAPPPPLSPAAAFCRGLVPGASALQRVRMALQGQWRNRLVAGAAVFTAAFSEFEVAALSSVTSWTVTLFQAHAGGLAWSSSFALALLPALVQLAAVGLGVLAARSWRNASSRSVRGDTHRPAPIGFWSWLTATALLGALVPLVLVAAEGGAARDLPWAQLATEVGWSLWFAAPAALCSWWLAGRIRQRPAHWWPWCVPGLCGALLVGLSVLAVFQLPGAARLYDTPVPLLLALSLLVLPAALLLRSSLEGRSGTAVHLAKMLAQSRTPRQRRRGSWLGWQLRGRPRVLLWGLLLFGCLFEVTASALLHPVTMTPAAVRLYNLMHYGHGAVLSGMVLALVASGLALLALVTWLSGLAVRTGGRRA